MGAIAVPSDAYYGAQTQRSLQNFRIGGERFRASSSMRWAWSKPAAARVNTRLGKLDPKLLPAIEKSRRRGDRRTARRTFLWWCGRPAAAPRPT